MRRTIRTGRSSQGSINPAKRSNTPEASETSQIIVAKIRLPTTDIGEPMRTGHEPRQRGYEEQGRHGEDEPRGARDQK
jgi:hypothetical protein